MTDDTRHDSTASEQRVDGLLVVERGRAALGRLVDGRVDTVATLDGQVTGGARAGTGDPDAFERERDRGSREFFHEVADCAERAFLGDDGVDRLAVGGPMHTVDAFLGGSVLDDGLRDRVVATEPVEHASERGLHELVEAAGDTLLDQATRRRRATVDEFFARLRAGGGAVYGAEAVEQAIERGAVETALISADVDSARREKIAGAVTDQGGETLVIPDDTERGSRYAKTFGVGALLED